jgi:dynein heavy chain
VELFKINYVPSTDLEFVEKEILNLEAVWLHKEQWDKRLKEIMQL